VCTRGSNRAPARGPSTSPLDGHNLGYTPTCCQLLRRTMIRSRLVIAPGTLLLCAITTAETINVAAFTRDPGVKRWISYDVLGPGNHPFPVVYLTTQHFKTWVGELLTVLPSARFDIVSSHTQTRMARADCPGKEPTGDVWYTVRISQHDKKHTQSCVLPQALACEYLSGVSKLSGMNWTAAELRPITVLMSEVRCNPGSTRE
jgi:hypothetical protein